MNNDAMKSTLLGLLYGFLIGLIGSPVETGQARLPIARGRSQVPPAIVCAEEPAALPQQLPEEVTVRGSDRKPVAQPHRPISLTEPRRPWLLPDKTWQAMANSRVNLDVALEHGQPYIGVRFALPFGS
jgi:hypothetical protein